MKSNIFYELFVLEIGNNHLGDIDRAVKIVETFSRLARENNIKAAIKPQFRHANSFIHKDFFQRKDIRYIKRTLETVLSEKECGRIVKVIRDNGCIPMVTPFDEKSTRLCQELDIPLIKIASSNITDRMIVNAIAELNKPVIASLGGACVEEIDALEAFFRKKNIPLALNHCVSKYPVEDHELELNQIDFLRNRYPDCTIGFSSHEYHDWTSSLMIAYAKGARTFERHVDINTDGNISTPFSSLPEQIDIWFKAFHKAKEMCGGDGSQRAKVLKEEKEYINSVSRGVYAKTYLSKGHALLEQDVYLAIPLQEGQLSSREFKSGERLLLACEKDQPIMRAMIDK